MQEIYNHCNGGAAQVIEDIFGKLNYDMNNDGIITPLDKFKELPHLNEKQEVITDYEGYAPTLYPYEGKWFVSWVSSEGDSILDFQAESPEKAIELAYNHLFGSKCLPDKLNEDDFAKSEPKPAEPKFKVGDKVVLNPCSLKNGLKGEVLTIDAVDREDNTYVVLSKTFYNGVWCSEDELEPYTEPTANYVQVDYHGADTAASTIADDCQSQPVTDCHDFNHILKDGFRGHNRLHIAAQIVAALYANYQAAKDFKSIEELVRKALDITDTLIKESEKGGSK